MKKISLMLLFVLMVFTGVAKADSSIDLMLPPVLNSNQDCSVYTQVRASHILVKTQAQAIKIRQEITAGKSFADAAREYSICPSKDDGGDLGYFCRGMMVPEFEDAAFNLPIGRLSEPVQTEFGWHLILVTDKK